MCWEGSRTPSAHTWNWGLIQPPHSAVCHCGPVEGLSTMMMHLWWWWWWAAFFESLIFCAHYQHSMNGPTTYKTHLRVLGFFSISFIYLFIWSCSMWDLSSLTRDRTCAPGSGSSESYPLGTLGKSIYIYRCLNIPHILAHFWSISTTMSIL